MPRAANQFDYETIADVVVTIDYTALEGPSAFRAEVVNRLGNVVQAEHLDDPVQEQAIRQRFKQEEIKDILLVISYRGHTSAWT